MLEQRVLSILEEQISSLIAQSLVRRCATALGLRPRQLEARHLPELARELGVGIRLFVDAEHQQALLDRIRTLEVVPELETSVVPIESEVDMSRARHAARTAALALGAGPFAAQKVVTIASELARNIVLYAGSGRIEFGPTKTKPPRLRIVASDRGPGIADVDHVFSGEYRSKTGMGRGLLSVRRIAEHFQLDTGPNGTVVIAELAL